jgi:hypothetical protein
MKIATITIQIEDPELKAEILGTRCTYKAESGLWVIEGQIYARHLKALSEITNILRQTDKGQKND